MVLYIIEITRKLTSIKDSSSLVTRPTKSFRRRMNSVTQWQYILDPMSRNFGSSSKSCVFKAS